MQPLNVIHVDDDPDTLTYLKTLLKPLSNVHYLRGFTSANEALVFLKKERIDLIFLDIEMPGHNGLWLAEQIADMPIDIVFLTAHAGYAIKAFEVCALNYLLKPPDEERLQLVLRQATEYHDQRQRTHEQIEAFYRYMNPKQLPNKIFINMSGRIIVIKLEDIIYFISKRNYTEVALKNGQREICSKTIKVFAGALLNHPNFLRVSRSYIINKEYLKTIFRDPAGNISLVMENGDIIETSFKSKEEILDKLEGGMKA